MRRIKYGKFKVALDGVKSSRVVVIPENINVMPTYALSAEPEFKRFWKKNHEAWERLRGM